MMAQWLKTLALTEVPGSVPNTQSSQPPVTQFWGIWPPLLTSVGSAVTLVHFIHAGKTLREVNASLLRKFKLKSKNS